MPAIVARYDGLSWGFEGDQKKKTELLVALAGGFIIALFAMYALIAIPLHSFLQPLLIITAIPFGFVGAALGHLLPGYDLSILSMFGVIALAGIVVNDNIVLVDWINKQREQQSSLFDAVRTAGAARLADGIPHILCRSLRAARRHSCAPEVERLERERQVAAQRRGDRERALVAVRVHEEEELGERAAQASERLRETVEGGAPTAAPGSAVSMHAPYESAGLE